MKVKLYIEGGGDSRSLHIKCREGFRKLFDRAGFTNPSPTTKACGSRDAAYDDFKKACASGYTDVFPVLLVDSEDPVHDSVWRHLQNRDGWNKPEGATDDQAQLMVQCMETWCVADQQTLQDFFGQYLQMGALPALNDLEEVSKDVVQKALSNATKQCGKDRAYAKGKRSFELVGQLNPGELKKHLPHFVRLCDMLNEKL